MSPAIEMKSALFWSVFLLLALVQGIAGNDNGDRISCFPLPGKIFLEASSFNFIPKNSYNLTILKSIGQLVNRQLCEEKGCVWDGLADNINCFLYTDGSQSYGYEV